MVASEHAEASSTNKNDYNRTGALGRRLKKFANLFLLFVVVVLSVALASCFFAQHNFYADLLVNFRSQYLWLGILAMVLAGIQRRAKTLVVVGLLTLPHGVQVLPYYMPPKFLQTKLAPRFSDSVELPEENLVEQTNGTFAEHQDQAVFRVLSYNVLYLNHEYQKFIDLIRATAPDMVVTAECTPVWYDAIKTGVQDTHPYSSRDVFPDWSGIRVFSRYPLRAATDDFSFRLIPESEQLMAVTLDWNGQSIRMIGVHTASPTSVGRFERRNRELEQLGSIGPHVVGPTIMAGDFNCTSGSPHFRQMLSNSGFVDSRAGFGWQPSWPAWLPTAFRIPIDHVLLNDSWEVIHREVGPAIGSDHLPVIIDLQLKSTTRS